MVALTTVGSARDAERLAFALVERRLAACVNVVPGVVSHYRWRGELQRDQERLLVIKTRAERLPALGEALRELHPYELPELIALEITAGSEAYLSWLDEASLAAVGRSRTRAPTARAPGRPRGPRGPRSRR